MLALQADGASVTTIEGLAAADGTLHPMQEMFREHHALQCGFCTPGMVMSAIDLVQTPPRGPDRAGDPRRAGRQSLPLHRLPQHRQGDRRRVAADARQGTRQPPNRRDEPAGRTDARPFEGIGASVRRKEDLRFLSGRGHYTDDINRPGQLYAVIKRADRPHARIVGDRHRGGAGGARRGRGLHRRRHGGRQIGGLPCGWQIHNKDGSPMAEPPHPVLAVGKVRHVGDPVAVVIAETKQQAKDAAELLDDRLRGPARRRRP